LAYDWKRWVVAEPESDQVGKYPRCRKNSGKEISGPPADLPEAPAFTPGSRHFSEIFFLAMVLEAAGGIEPPNKGFAVLSGVIARQGSHKNIQ